MELLKVALRVEWMVDMKDVMTVELMVALMAAYSETPMVAKKVVMTAA